ncbi:hypothetical protein B0H14DRAFT_3090047 [Mycena olivaceomarginata]|nr:hypothetical protein B0H14DRAFT_3090047 [Mycena olivaceomarginata]
MPNPIGKNGYGKEEHPPDHVLRETLTTYVKQGLLQNAKLLHLKEDHNLVNQIERRLNIPSVKRDTRTRPHEETVQAIIDEAEKDVSQNNGPRFIKDKLKDKLIMVPRYCTRGDAGLYPGKKKSTIVRHSLSAIGPWHEVSSDGHEKLSALALRMGDIYAYKDKWTANLLKINIVPNCRTAGAIGHLFLDFLEETGIAPLQTTTDRGSETGWQYAIQTAIREAFAPDIDPKIYPCAAFLKSVHNTVIEAFWHWLRDKWGINMRDHILRGKAQRFYIAEAPFYRCVIFPPLVQAQLDEFRTYWNQHTIRSQPEKEMLSGHATADALEHPGLFGGLDCEVGPREAHLSWVTPDFDQIAADIFQTLPFSEITLENSWDVLSEMSHRLDAM